MDHLRRLPIVLTLLLAGCYVRARGGPTYGFDGAHRGTTMEVVLGTEFHFGDHGGLSVDGRHALTQSIGVIRAPAVGVQHSGVVYEIGGSAFVTLRHKRRTDDRASPVTLLRADLGLEVGQLTGIKAKGAGGFVGVLGLVELEHYWNGWAVRVGGGVLAEAVTIEDRAPRPARFEAWYAPVGAVTIEFTPLVVLLFDRITGNWRYPRS